MRERKSFRAAKPIPGASVEDLLEWGRPNLERDGVFLRARDAHVKAFGQRYGYPPDLD